MREREKKKKKTDLELFSKTVYLIHQFKRREEIELLRSVYGRLFFQVSAYSRRGARVDYLSRKFSENRNFAEPNQYRSEAEALVQKDENEIDADHGQRVGKIFHDADFIVNIDLNTPSVASQVDRFCELIFGSNSISPTKFEYGMFLAKAAAKTGDLFRVLPINSRLLDKISQSDTYNDEKARRELGWQPGKVLDFFVQ